MVKKKTVPEKLSIALPVHVAMDMNNSEQKSGFIAMQVQGCSFTLCKNLEKPTQKTIGEVVGCIGGGIEIRIEDAGYNATYHINPWEIWNAIIKILDVPELIYVPKKERET